MSRLRFDPRRPLFVSQVFSAFNKVWSPDSHFPWEDMGLTYQEETIHQLYNSNFLNHRPDLESSLVEITEKAVGDGLESYTVEALHNLVNTINKSVKLKCKTENEYTQKKCPISQIKDKQIGKIRMWRSAYGHLE